MADCTGSKKLKHSKETMIKDGDDYWSNNTHYQPMKCPVKGCDCTRVEVLNKWQT